MAKNITQNTIDFTVNTSESVGGFATKRTNSNLITGEGKYDTTTKQYLIDNNQENIAFAVNAVDIDWNGAQIAKTVINSTGDLLKLIQSINTNINNNTLFQPKTEKLCDVTFTNDTIIEDGTGYVFTDSINLSELTENITMLNGQIVITSLNITNPPFHARKYCLLNTETSETSFIDTPEKTDQNAVLLDIPNGYSNIKIGISFDLNGGPTSIVGKTTKINIKWPEMYITQNPTDNQELDNTSVAHSFIVPEILTIKEELKKHTSISIDKTFTDGTHVTDMDGLLDYIDALSVMLQGLYSQITVNTGE